ncbi:flavin-containing monooxygenase [Flexivirga meconopsidis]|uniref:flavin-containing monooxygenase n=1 Tax=Flexivirga meconopsidis TaxID=2977121 RepID=UPI00223E9A2F|nr:NAD(P)/FAD-dependent oxidoreductase [Flexivirga meconopsidis]
MTATVADRTVGTVSPRPVDDLSGSGEHTHAVLIVGAGFSGIGMAIRLRQEGIHDAVVLERASTLGGTWRDNTYPGSACDVMSLLYSFSFAPSTTWAHTFGKQPEILAYLQECSERFGISDQIRYNQEVVEARWDERESVWTVHTGDTQYRARVLVNATGYLSDPSLPDVPGVADFTGRIVHTSAWDAEIDLTGKRVAVVGTGASAIQVVPAIQPQVESLDLYQRTPAWVAPKPDKEITDREKWVRRNLPGYQRFRRNFNKYGREVLIPMLSRPAVMEKTLQGQALKMLGEQIEDPQLREQLTPDYTVGCKRILFSNAYYPALAASNTTLVPSAVTGFTETGVVADGVERPADVVVLATGFQATKRPVADRIVGRDGQSLTDAWSQTMSAYLGTTVHGFPNLFLMLGPNTALGHSSQTVMIEAQIEYVLGALRTMQDRGVAALEVREEVQRSYVEWLQNRFEGTVWQSGGCTSWYQDSTGHNPSIWPTFTWTFRKQTRNFRAADYALVTTPVRASA